MKAALVVLALTVLAAGCARSPAKAEGNAAAARVVSVGSAVTESVFALGAGDAVVGVDTSSLFPEAATKLPKVGYQRTLSAEGVLGLRPTLVLASSEAGPAAVLEQLRAAGVRVETVPTDPGVEGAKACIRRTAALVGRDPSKVIAAMDADLDRARVLVGQTTTRPKALVLYARGGGTLHVLGTNTAAEAMLRLSGAESAVTGFAGAKPLTPEALVQAAPDVIVIPSRGLESLGGADALARVSGVSETPAGKAKRFVAMDDLLLLGFGPRTGEAAIALSEKLHPELTAGAN